MACTRSIAPAITHTNHLLPRATPLSISHFLAIYKRYFMPTQHPSLKEYLVYQPSRDLLITENRSSLNPNNLLLGLAYDLPIFVYVHWPIRTKQRFMYPTHHPKAGWHVAFTVLPKTDAQLPNHYTTSLHTNSLFHYLDYGEHPSLLPSSQERMKKKNKGSYPIVITWQERKSLLLA
jgi:hypothetical protein